MFVLLKSLSLILPKGGLLFIVSMAKFFLRPRTARTGPINMEKYHGPDPGPDPGPPDPDPGPPLGTTKKPPTARAGGATGPLAGRWA